MSEYTPGTAGHGPKGGYRADLEVLRQYFRDNDPSYSAYSRRSLGGARKRRRARAKQDLTVAQERLLDFAKEQKKSETWLMDRLQSRKLVPSTRVWLHELSEEECKAAFAIFDLREDKGNRRPKASPSGMDEAGLTQD